VRPRVAAAPSPAGFSRQRGSADAIAPVAIRIMIVAVALVRSRFTDLPISIAVLATYLSHRPVGVIGR